MASDRSHFEQQSHEDFTKDPLGRKIKEKIINDDADYKNTKFDIFETARKVQALSETLNLKRMLPKNLK
jgi:hypothetical protein